MVWNYLRVRGEYDPADRPDLDRLELPPRTRRIHPGQGGFFIAPGTTSAYAENTSNHTQHTTKKWNYLRVRGEYRFSNPPSTLIAELPPRTRRIPDLLHKRTIGIGTTSAYAENTHDGHGRIPRKRNYLRVRGEYLICSTNAPSG